jgi:hypothetical protein
MWILGIFAHLAMESYASLISELNRRSPQKLEIINYLPFEYPDMAL